MTVGSGTTLASSLSVLPQVAAGSQKQIRGDLLDLMWHPLPLKLLVLVDIGGEGWGGTAGGDTSGVEVGVDLGAVKELVGELAEGVQRFDVAERWEGEVRL